MEPHPVLSVWYRRNITTQYKGQCFKSTLTFNEFGSRSLPLQELRQKKEAWFYVGDSMTAGFEVNNESVFTNIIQKHLPDIAIVNLSKSGSGPIYYNKVIQNFVEDEEIHQNVTKVYYCIYMGNDFKNMFQETPDSFVKILIKKYFYRIRVYHLLRIIFIHLRAKVVSRIFPQIEEASGTPTKTVKNPSHRKKQLDTSGAMEFSSKNHGQIQGGAKLPFYAYSNDSSEQAFAILEKTLETMHQFLREHQIELIVVAVPSVKQIQAGLEHPLYTYPIQALENITQQHHMAFYNLAKDMIAYKDHHDLPYPYLSFECDGHFNEDGHQVIAELLLDYAKQH
jgi:hypothetical protein